MLKQARIDPNGRIVNADQSIHTTKNPGYGGPDQVQWLRTPGNNGTFKIRFKSSPFQAGFQEIDVPPSVPQTVSQDLGTYKYEVLRDGTVTDDPDVIIE